MKKAIKNNIVSKVKKDIRKFLSEEEAKICEKDIIKIGLPLISAGMILGGLTIAGDVKGGGLCSHSSHSIHSVHYVHSAHNHGGWC